MVISRSCYDLISPDLFMMSLSGYRLRLYRGCSCDLAQTLIWSQTDVIVRSNCWLGVKLSKNVSLFCTTRIEMCTRSLSLHTTFLTLPSCVKFHSFFSLRNPHWIEWTKNSHWPHANLVLKCVYSHIHFFQCAEWHHQECSGGVLDDITPLPACEW